MSLWTPLCNRQSPQSTAPGMRASEKAHQHKMSNPSPNLQPNTLPSYLLSLSLQHITDSPWKFIMKQSY